jgi:hydroxyethylthiazole kinase-like uncharacterized protein yjeF
MHQGAKMGEKRMNHLGAAAGTAAELVLLSAEEMRAAEARAMAGGVSGAELMERAGAGVAAAIVAAWAPMRAVVLCGAGNNGGDGYVVARHLAEAGWRVEVLRLGAARSAEALAMAEAWGGPVGEVLGALPAPGEAVLVDALFGTGLTRDLAPEVAARLVEIAARLTGGRVAVDLPSGVEADTGRDLAGGVDLPWFDLCVTFHRPRPGHYLGRPRIGRLVVVDIGLDATPGRARRVGGPAGDLAKGQGHKFSHGHAVVLSGPPGAGGAARLAGRAALRVGAGLVSLGVPPEAMAEHAARLDAIMLRPLADAAALAAWLEDRRITAACLGPGLGCDGRGAELLRVALEARRPMVMDADGLTLLSRDPGLRGLLHPDCVLTPHGGEFARLFPDLDQARKIESVAAAAARVGAVVLLKGADTVIADPGGAVALHAAQYERSAPWLATAGSGDVLAGLITGLLARGFGPMAAAETGAWLHVEAALAFGPGLIAEDLPEILPKVLARLV